MSTIVQEFKVYLTMYIIIISTKLFASSMHGEIASYIELL